MLTQESTTNHLAMPPLRVHFDDSACSTLKEVLLESTLFIGEEEARLADVVIFGSDDVSYLKQSELYRLNREKNICITESDIPTFLLPGLYAASNKSFLTRRRVETINYFISERARGNTEIRKLVGKTHEKKYLYSFTGGSNSWARKRLFRLVKPGPDLLLQPTDKYNHWDKTADDESARAAQQLWYADVMASSKFALCPRGCGLSSYRLFESMSLGVVPVIISDDWKPITGVDWSFALRVPEKHISKIDGIVRQHENEWRQRGQVAQETYALFFAREVVAKTIYDRVVPVLESYSASRESIATFVSRVRAQKRQLGWHIYAKFKHMALVASKASGIPVPIQLNRPVDVQLQTAKK